MSQAQRVLVTGGGRGIGRAISAAFLAAGSRVVIGQETERDARRAAVRLGAATTQLHAVGADLADAAACGRLVDRAVEFLGGLDVVVNNAAMTGAPVLREFERTDDDLLDRIVEVNLKAPFRVARSAVPHLIPGSAIINISSVGGFVAQKHATAYCATKGGLELMTKGMALDLAERGIRVVGIAPGDIATPASDRAARSRSAQSLDSYQRVVPLQKRGTGADVAGAVLFAASDRAAYITGTTIIVDGGWLASRHQASEPRSSRSLERKLANKADATGETSLARTGIPSLE
jgi:NAD(P)-dependent dehydrogenase (short-subunit alcohol dehydrogenase family)